MKLNTYSHDGVALSILIDQAMQVVASIQPPPFSLVRLNKQACSSAEPLTFVIVFLSTAQHGACSPGFGRV